MFGICQLVVFLLLISSCDKKQEKVKLDLKKNQRLHSLSFFERIEFGSWNSIYYNDKKFNKQSFRILLKNNNVKSALILIEKYADFEKVSIPDLTDYFINSGLECFAIHRSFSKMRPDVVTVLGTINVKNSKECSAKITVN